MVKSCYIYGRMYGRVKGENMNIIVRLEQEGDYRRVEEITREAFDDPFYPGRDKRNDIGCPFS